MQTRDKLFISLIIVIILCTVIYTVRSILSPFICSIVLAYLLSPPVNYLNKKHKVSRVLSTLLIITLFLTITSLLLSYILPIIYTQLINFINTIPSYINIIYYDFYPKFLAYLQESGFEIDNKKINEMFFDKETTANFVNFSRNFFTGALNSSYSLVNAFSLIFITPILLFYLIKDWESMISCIKSHLPKKSAKTIIEVAKKIDLTLSQYIRGQLNVCLMLGLFYAILLNFSGLNFGFLIGFLTGIFSFIPFIGMIIGVVIGITVALFQWGLDFVNIGTVALIFAIGQFIEGNFVTPKLIGDRIGVHPAWLIFGLFFFGAILGIVGIIVAVPLTAIFGVLIKFFAAEYKKKFT